MLELTVRGQRIEGAPVTWNSRQVVLLARDGQLWQFAPSEAADYRKTSDWFRGYSPSQLRASLLRELGSGFEVTGTGHYMVAHPSGGRDQWADRFEDLYRRFVRYFSVRGFTLTEPPFLLVAVVCRKRAEFTRYAATNGSPAGAGVVGYYCTQTNRIVLYDVGARSASPARWEQNAGTVVHEATHQMAFNTGIHNRTVQPPLWVAEGLATMFEGVAGSEASADGPRRSRVNRSRLRAFRDGETAGHRPEAVAQVAGLRGASKGGPNSREFGYGLLADLVATDRLFESAPGAAYAKAWALTFYLMETQSSRYADYLARTAARPSLERYTATQRTADFTAVFGDNWRMLEARLLRFIDEIN
jgi:hypothetical protein